MTIASILGNNKAFAREAYFCYNMADRKSAEMSRPSSKVSKTSVTDAVSKLTAKALRQYKLNSDNNGNVEDLQEEVGKYR